MSLRMAEGRVEAERGDSTTLPGVDEDRNGEAANAADAPLPGRARASGSGFICSGGNMRSSEAARARGNRNRTLR